MPTFIICLNLKRRYRTYLALEERIAEFETCLQLQQNVWVINAKSNSTALAGILKPHLGAEDEIFVGKLDSDTDWHGFSAIVTNWLGAYARRDDQALKTDRSSG